MTVNVTAPASANGASVASLICGVIAALTTWIPVVGFIGLFCGIAGLITGIIGVRHENGRVLAIVGLIGSAISIVVFILYLVLFGAILAAAGSATPTAH